MTKRAMARAARAMVTAMRWQVMKRVLARSARAIVTAMRMEGGKEGDGKEGKGDGNGN